MGGYIGQAVENLKQFEGSIPWMYLDTVGKVTVGVGLMLVNEVAAHALPFLRGDRAATSEEIREEFLRVSSMKKGRVAKFYATSNGLRLSPETVDERLRLTLEGFEGYLRSHLEGYDELPTPAKLALLDMVYNLGPGRFFAEYPRMIAAVERGDWPTAAGLSARRGPAEARNAWTRQQFLEAGRSIELKAGAAESPVEVLLLGLLTGVAAALAVAVLSGEVDQLAARRRSRSRRPAVLYAGDEAP